MAVCSAITVAAGRTKANTNNNNMKSTAQRIAAVAFIALSVATCSCTKSVYKQGSSADEKNRLLYLDRGCYWAEGKEMTVKPQAPLNHFCHEN
jgi:hypothetical protein